MSAKRRRTPEEWKTLKARCVKVIRDRRTPMSQQEKHTWLTTETRLEGLPLTETEYLDCLYAANSWDDDDKGGTR